MFILKAHIDELRGIEHALERPRRVAANGIERFKAPPRTLLTPLLISAIRLHYKARRT